MLADRARPLDTSERLVLLDVLRGFALGGVWRSLTYGKAQPLRQDKGVVAPSP